VLPSKNEPFIGVSRMGIAHYTDFARLETTRSRIERARCHIWAELLFTEKAAELLRAALIARLHEEVLKSKQQSHGNTIPRSAAEVGMPAGDPCRTILAEAITGTGWPSSRTRKESLCRRGYWTRSARVHE
jgi:hypothetical protein